MVPEMNEQENHGGSDDEENENENDEGEDTDGEDEDIVPEEEMNEDEEDVTEDEELGEEEEDPIEAGQAPVVLLPQLPEIQIEDDDLDLSEEVEEEEEDSDMNLIGMVEEIGHDNEDSEQEQELDHHEDHEEGAQALIINGNSSQNGVATIEIGSSEDSDEDEDQDEEHDEDVEVDADRPIMAGPYILLHKLKTSAKDTVEHFVARKAETEDEFVVLKILKDRDDNSFAGLQGKIQLHTEYTILKILDGVEGVPKLIGLFKYVSGNRKRTINRHLCLVLECYSNPSQDIICLSDYIFRRKCLPQDEAFILFCRILVIVRRLHDRNIIHRDLKATTIYINARTKDIIIADFGIAKLLIREDELLKEAIGSPEFNPPEVFNRIPHHGKPLEMWAMGVLFYSMLFGRLPFRTGGVVSLNDLVCQCHYAFPNDVPLFRESVQFLRSLLVIGPEKRLTCLQAIQKIPKNYYYIATIPPADKSVGPDTSIRSRMTVPVLVPHDPSADMDNVVPTMPE